MNTQIYRIADPKAETEKIDAAAALLRAGEVVAIPTETVYGLAANALDSEAVKKIFVAKGFLCDLQKSVIIRNGNIYIDIVVPRNKAAVTDCP